mgnify:CR=1 FL=1
MKMPEPKKPRDPSKRPSADEPLVPLKVNVTPSLKQALEKHMENLSLQATEGGSGRETESGWGRGGQIIYVAGSEVAGAGCGAGD